MVHELKIHPKFFNDVFTGKKNFEVRKNDRKFKAGDILVLKEWIHGEYTGDAIDCKVTYVLNDENYCKEGYVVLGIRRIGEWLYIDGYPDDIVCPFCVTHFNMDDNCTEMFDHCPRCGAFLK